MFSFYAWIVWGEVTSIGISDLSPGPSPIFTSLMSQVRSITCLCRVCGSSFLPIYYLSQFISGGGCDVPVETWWDGYNHLDPGFSPVRTFCGLPYFTCLSKLCPCEGVCGETQWLVLCDPILRNWTCILGKTIWPDFNNQDCAHSTGCGTY